jgi:hypothetical protein
MKKLILAALVVCVVSPAWGISWNELQKSPADFRFGYFSGAYGAFLTYQNTKGFEKMICLPHGVTAGQLFAIVEKYLKTRPEDWNFEAASTAHIAWQKAFPCK